MFVCLVGFWVNWWIGGILGGLVTWVGGILGGLVGCWFG